MSKTVDRATWGSLRQLNTRFLRWCAANHEQPSSVNLLRWLFVEDFGPDRDGWSLMRVGYLAAVEPAKPSIDEGPPGPSASGG